MKLNGKLMKLNELLNAVKDKIATPKKRIPEQAPKLFQELYPYEEPDHNRQRPIKPDKNYIDKMHKSKAEESIRDMINGMTVWEREIVQDELNMICLRSE